jgi:uncharacterized protein (DUF1330 family)
MEQYKVIYVLLDVTIKDKTRFLQYVDGHRPSMQQYGGKLLFRSNDLEVIEGSWSPKLFVVQEWPSADAFYNWHNSTEYAPWKKLRQECMNVNMVLARTLKP